MIGVEFGDVVAVSGIVERLWSVLTPVVIKSMFEIGKDRNVLWSEIKTC